MNIILLLILDLSLILISFYLDISFKKRADEMIKDLHETRQEMNKLSSISATQCGQKIVEGNKSFHCGVEESGFHAYNCNDCPNKCEEYYQWDKEINKRTKNAEN